MQTKPEIKIVPVFDQASNPKIWSEFARIEMLCRTTEYNYAQQENIAQNIINGFKRVWEQKDNIAFAAYDGQKMVGFAKCHSTEDPCEIYFSDLYVNPQYKGLGIGKRLLEQRERASGIFYSYISLLALNEKVASYFVKRGFNNYDNRYMTKKLPERVIGVIPVFQPLVKLRAKTKVKYDKAIVNQCKNCPVFVYVNDKFEIDGVAVETPDKEVKIWVNESKRGMVDFYKKMLLNAINNVR